MKRLLTLSSVLLLISCTDSDEKKPYKFEFNEELYTQNRQLWENSNIENYAFTQTYFSESSGPGPKLRIVIRNNELDTIYIQQENAEGYDVENYPRLESIPACYDFINQLAKNLRDDSGSDHNAVKSTTIYVNYDKQYHYPKSIYASSSFWDKELVGGLHIDVVNTDFEILPNEE